MLQPNKRIQSALVSSTSRFTDVYRSRGFSITHASSIPDEPRAKASYAPNPVCRNSFVISFPTEPREKLAQPMYEPYTEYAKEITAFMAVLFGKRFDSHGLIQCEGLLHLPSIEPYQQIVDHRLCTTTTKRDAILRFRLNSQKSQNWHHCSGRQTGVTRKERCLE